jgi:enoyl-CoA hydratase
MLARPDARNAQNKKLLYELNDAYDRACQDDAAKVIILGADGPDFSSGHDLRDQTSMSEFTPVTCWGGFDQPGAEGYMAMEEEYYLGLCQRWRSIPKPVIAQVQGRAIAGALMLVWPCDLIVASEDATFSDPIVAFGLNGHEFFVHAFELGHRRAKELLFTGAPLTAQEAQICGMVNKVVPLVDLSSFTLEYASRIAEMPSMGLRLAKMSVNQALDAQGFETALQAAFSLHQLGHSNNMQVYGMLSHPDGPATVRKLSQHARAAR